MEYTLGEPLPELLVGFNFKPGELTASPQYDSIDNDGGEDANSPLLYERRSSSSSSSSCSSFSSDSAARVAGKRGRAKTLDLNAMKNAAFEEIKGAESEGQPIGLSLFQVLATPRVRAAMKKAYPFVATEKQALDKAKLVISNFLCNPYDSRLLPASGSSSDPVYIYNASGVDSTPVINNDSLIRATRLTSSKRSLPSSPASSNQDSTCSSRTAVVRGSKAAYALAEGFLARGGAHTQRSVLPKTVSSAVHAALRCNSGGRNHAFGIAWWVEPTTSKAIPVSVDVALDRLLASDGDGCDGEEGGWELGETVEVEQRDTVGDGVEDPELLSGHVGGDDVGSTVVDNMNRSIIRTSNHEITASSPRKRRRKTSKSSPEGKQQWQLQQQQNKVAQSQQNCMNTNGQPLPVIFRCAKDLRCTFRGSYEEVAEHEKTGLCMIPGETLGTQECYDSRNGPRCDESSSVGSDDIQESNDDVYDDPDKTDEEEESEELILNPLSSTSQTTSVTHTPGSPLGTQKAQARGILASATSGGDAARKGLGGNDERFRVVGRVAVL